MFEFCFLIIVEVAELDAELPDGGAFFVQAGHDKIPDRNEGERNVFALAVFNKNIQFRISFR